MLQTLCQVFPGFRDKLVAATDEWITDEGQLLPFVWMHILTESVVAELQVGNYADADTWFEVIERLLVEGDGEVQAIIATGFLEGMQHQTQLEGKYWAPLLGPLSRQHCRAMDQFHGVATAGLDTAYIPLDADTSTTRRST
jgi:hypothetical protein